VVHINRMKRAFKQRIWKAKERKRCYRKRQTRQPEQEEDEQVAIAHRPVSIPVPQKANRQQVPKTPSHSPQYNLDTRSTAPVFRCPRNQSGSKRMHPPLTRLQSQLQALEETVEQVDQ
jgi:hypothetical protein